MRCHPSRTEQDCCPQAATLQELLPHGSVPRGPSPRSKLLQHGSPTGGSSPQTPCSCVGSSPRAAAPARGLLLRGLSMGRSLLQATSTCSTGGSSTGCSVEICSVWDPWAAGGQPAPPGASPPAAGELCCVPGAPPALLLHSPWGLQGCFSLSSHPSLPAAVAQQISPFFNLLSQRPNQPHSLAHLWPAVGPFWSWLELGLI